MKKINILQNCSKGTKATAVFFMANVITAGIAYLTTPIFTRILSAGQFGQVSLYLTWKQILGIVAMFCLSYGVFNNGMSDYPTRRDSYSFSMLVLSNIITVLFGVLLLSCYPWVKHVLGLDIPLVLLLLFTFLLQPAFNFWLVRQRYEFKYKYVALWSVLSSLLSPLVALACLYFLHGNKVYERLFGSEVTLLVFYIAFYIYLARAAKWQCDKSYWKEALLFNLPLIPHYLSSYLLASSDKVMISFLCNNSETAFYSVAYSIASVGLLVWSAANASLVPYTYEKCKQKKYQDISRVTCPILVLYAAFSFVVILLTPEIMSFLATAQYQPAIYVVPPVVAGIFFQVQYYMYANVLYYYKKPKYVMLASVSATLLNLILNYIFIPRYGYIAAAYTTLICYLFQAIIDFFAMKKMVKNSIYNMKFVVVFSLGMIIICFASGLLYHTTWIRYLILVALSGICIHQKQKIIVLFKALKEF